MNQLIRRLASNLKWAAGFFLNEDITMPNLENLIGQTNQSLDVILLGVPGIFEDDHIPSFRLTKRCFISEFIDEDPISRMGKIRAIIRLQFMGVKAHRTGGRNNRPFTNLGVDTRTGSILV